MDFKFLQNPLTKNWVILAPRRASRPDEAKGDLSFCPFCPGSEEKEPDIYRVGGQDQDSKWQIRVIPNKFPFAPIHEVIIHSPEHDKSLEELPNEHVELILKTFRQRFQAHKDKGQVYIFHNHGEKAGESIPHAHTQLTVVPDEVALDIPRLAIGNELEEVAKDQAVHETEHFQLFCPKSSQWPDEVWVHPRKDSNYFGGATDEQLLDLAVILKRLIQIFSLRHGSEFPYNFYIYPGKDWYLRLIPRDKGLGGFEVGTGVYVNTQDPSETIEFIKKHFEEGLESEISRVDYGRGV